MLAPMRIALAQILSGTDPTANLSLVRRYAREAADAGEVELRVDALEPRRDLVVAVALEHQETDRFRQQEGKRNLCLPAREASRSPFRDAACSCTPK